MFIPVTPSLQFNVFRKIVTNTYNTVEVLNINLNYELTRHFSCELTITYRVVCSLKKFTNGKCFQT